MTRAVISHGNRKNPCVCGCRMKRSLNFRGVLESTCEAVIQFDQTTWDMREDLLNAKSALEAREEVLAKNLEYLDSSDVEGTLELEKEIRRLMTEIDGYRGYLRKLEHDRRMATIQVALSFQQSSVPDSRPSNFPWINAVDFFRFMNISLQSGSMFGSAPISSSRRIRGSKAQTRMDRHVARRRSASVFGR